MTELAPAQIFLNGKVELRPGDCRDVIRAMPDNSIDSVVCDPPYALVSIVKRYGKEESHLHVKEGKDLETIAAAQYKRLAGGFMGKAWDTGEVAFADTFWREVLRVLKPGGHVVAFSGTRTYHRMAVAIEDAGFEIRDQLAWMYGCLDDKTMAVTPSGVMPYHKINIGDLVLAYDPSYMSYNWERVEEVFAYDIDDTVYRIATDYGDQVVSRNHRCILERGGVETFEFAEEAARECEIRVPVLEDLRALLDTIPDAHKGTGAAQSDVLGRVQECLDRKGDIGDGIAEDASGSRWKIAGGMLGLSSDVLAKHEAFGADGKASVLARVQWSESREGVEQVRRDGTFELEAGIGSGASRAYDGSDQPSMEGRRHVPEQERQLCERSLRQVSGGISADVAQGRVRDGASSECGDGDWSASGASGVRPSYRSQSAEQRTDEPNAVRHEQGPQTVRAWRGHKTVVGRITPERYSGVIWCVRVKSGAFVAVRNGFAFPTGNSGFPKSHDVSKGIDKAAPRVGMFAPFAAHYSERRKATGLTHNAICAAGGFFAEHNHGGASSNWEKGNNVPTVAQWALLRPLLGLSDDFLPLIKRIEAEREKIGERKSGDPVAWYGEAERGDGVVDITAPATDAARKWQGWGTALKPAWEPICLARKPLIGTVAENVLEHGTGALNIDGCRVGTDGGTRAVGKGKASAGVYGNGLNSTPTEKIDAGRWPANIVHDGSDEVVAGFPVTAAGNDKPRNNGAFDSVAKGHDYPHVTFGHADNGGSAARFFYTAKADKLDRIGSKHPTVKPVDLMQWLVRLVTPPGGLVLDPFAGSGSTGEAAWREGMRCILIEREAEYQADIAERLRLADKGPATRKARAIKQVANDNLPLFGGAEATGGVSR